MAGKLIEKSFYRGFTLKKCPKCGSVVPFDGHGHYGDAAVPTEPPFEDGKMHDLGNGLHRYDKAEFVESTPKNDCYKIPDPPEL